MIVCLHGFADSPHTWDLVRPYLGDVLAPPLAGHLGGRPLRGDFDLARDVEQAMDRAGLATAHLVGNSLGGYVALRLAERGRARSVVAFAPAGGADDHSETFEMQRRGVLLSELAARPLAPDAVAHLTAGWNGCDRGALLANARDFGWPLDGAKVSCPVRIVWGLEDRLLPYPGSAERYRRSLHADWVELDGIGHMPQLEAPLEAAQLILGFM